MAAEPSAKKALIDKANTRILVVTSIASVIIAFCLVASYALFSQMNYQTKVLNKKKLAQRTLQSDIQAFDSLKTSYNTFTSAPVNIVGGNAEGTGAQDGDNSKIILDALPSKYDYPALITSLEGIVNSQHATITSITGTDDQLAQTSDGSATPQPVEMPFEINVKGDYTAIQNVLTAMDRSIRPIKVQSVQIQADSDSITADIKAVTYYQPAKLLQIKQEVVK